MNRFRICLSIYGTTTEIERAIVENPEADLYEIRVDLSEAPDASVLRKTTPKPLVFTAHENPRMLEPYAGVADYFDAGGSKTPSTVKQIASFHGNGDPEIVWSSLKGDVRKVVLKTADYPLLLRLLELNRNGNSVCFGMGPVAQFSRIVSLFQGALWSYASTADRPTADGQFDFRSLLDVYRLQRFASAPEVFGIVGKPVAHSKSPAFQNRRFAEANKNWIYLPFHCEDLQSLLTYSPHFGVRGFSVTHPYKEQILPYLKESSSEVNAVRACNTLYWNDGWIGTNTDTSGVVEILKRLRVSLPDTRVLILGAGGSARSVASVVAGKAKEVIILNRSPQKANSLAQEFGGRAGSLNDFAKYDYDLLFQTTPVGMREGEAPVDILLLLPGKKVADVIYDPPETALLRKARELGCEILNGEAWFEAQAETQFQWWKLMDAKLATDGHR